VSTVDFSQLEKMVDLEHVIRFDQLVNVLKYLVKRAQTGETFSEEYGS